MKKKRPTEEQSLHHVSAWDILASLGINCEMLEEHLRFATDFDIDQRLNELLRNLSNSNEMMALFVIENEKLLRLVMVELPPNMAAIKIRNPLYSGASKPSDEISRDGDDDSMGELPF